MLIHAYRRKAAHKVELFGQTIEFQPNAAGQVVADVADTACTERLLAIPEGYRALEAGEAAPAQPAAPTPGAFVLTRGDETLDLAQLDDEALKAFAKDNAIEVHPRAKADTIRKAIVAALKGE